MTTQRRTRNVSECLYSLCAWFCFSILLYVSKQSENGRPLNLCALVRVSNNSHFVHRIHITFVFNKIMPKSDLHTHETCAYIYTLQSCEMAVQPELTQIVHSRAHRWRYRRRRIAAESRYTTAWTALCLASMPCFRWTPSSARRQYSVMTNLAKLECGQWPPSRMYVAPSVECCWSNRENNEAETRNPLKFAGVPQTPEPISAVSGPRSPYCEDIWRTYCCLTSSFPIVDTCLSCEDIVRESCAMVGRWRFFTSCIFSEPRAAHFRPAF